MKTTTILCDICSEKVAKYKCRFCGRDMCDYHIGNVSIRYQRSKYGNNVENVLISFDHNGMVPADKYICNDCILKIKERFNVLGEAQNKSKDAVSSLSLIDDLLEVFEKHAKIEVI